jgi:hypothetical protein
LQSRPSRGLFAIAAVSLALGPAAGPARASQPLVRVPGAAASGAAAASAPSDWDPRSTPASPCGRGVPPPGHVLPEIAPGEGGMLITVRQDTARL